MCSERLQIAVLNLAVIYSNVTQMTQLFGLNKNFISFCSIVEIEFEKISNSTNKCIRDKVIVYQLLISTVWARLSLK